MSDSISPHRQERRGFHWDFPRMAMVLGFLALDQFTKYLARARFSLPDGDPDYFKVFPLLGEWIQLRLVYNSGAAFGLKPQSYLPFLHPTLFYVVFSLVAIGVLIAYYRKLGTSDGWQKSGVALILSGAFGNLIDRLTMDRVTDFIDVGIPGVLTRWPTFNIADSCVCVGVGLILAAPLLVRKSDHPEAALVPQSPEAREGFQGPPNAL